MRKKTAVIAVSGAVALTVIGGAAVALPKLADSTGPGGRGGYGAPWHDRGGYGSPGMGENRQSTQADRKAAITTALASLVTKGTLSQAQADAIATQLSQAPTRTGGTPGESPSAPPTERPKQDDQTEAERTAERQQRIAARLAPLVTKKTISQAQADAAAKALADTLPGGRHGGWRGRGGRGGEGSATPGSSPTGGSQPAPTTTG